MSFIQQGDIWRCQFQFNSFTNCTKGQMKPVDCPLDIARDIIRIQEFGKEVSKDEHIRELMGGDINYVFAVGHRFVLKVQKKMKVIPRQLRYINMARENGVKVPEIIASGSYEGRDYMVMQYIKGVNLAEAWPSFTPQQKQKLIKSLCEQLKLLHGVQFDQYSICDRSKEIRSNRISQALLKFQQFDRVKKVVLEMQDVELEQKVQEIQTLYLNNLQIFDSPQGVQGQNRPCLIHNDLHFGNVLCDPELAEITGIVDFDFSCQMTRDYQLWRILAFFLKPEFYVPEDRQDLWKGTDFADEIKWMKYYYPEMFAIKDLKLKICIYFTNQILWDLEDGYSKTFREWYRSLYETDWLDRVLTAE